MRRLVGGSVHYAGGCKHAWPPGIADPISRFTASPQQIADRAGRSAGRLNYGSAAADRLRHAPGGASSGRATVPREVICGGASRPPPGFHHCSTLPMDVLTGQAPTSLGVGTSASCATRFHSSPRICGRRAPARRRSAAAESCALVPPSTSARPQRGTASAGVFAFAHRIHKAALTSGSRRCSAYRRPQPPAISGGGWWSRRLGDVPASAGTSEPRQLVHPVQKKMKGGGACRRRPLQLLHLPMDS